MGQSKRGPNITTKKGLLSQIIQLQNERTQDKARISQLEQQACEVEAFTSAGHDMDTFNNMRARIRELEDAIRKFLEVDMELDDKLNHPVGVEVSPNLYRAVNKAKRELLDIISDKSNQSDKEK